MYLQQKGGASVKEVLATGYIEKVVSTEGSTVVTVLVEALHLASANIVRSTLTLAFTPGEMLTIAESYDTGLGGDEEEDADDNVLYALNPEAAHG